jgi:BolA protein
MNSSAATPPAEGGASRLARIEQRITAGLAPLSCTVDDDSALHAGHAGAAAGGGHYRIRVVSAQFEGHKLVTRHRLVYDCVVDMMHTEIHALAITALAPSEVA